MIHDTKLSKAEQILVHSAAGSSFKKLIGEMRQEATAKQAIWEEREKQADLSKKFDFSW